MSYTPTIWQNSPSTATPISADNLNHIEQGIADLDDQLNGANGIAQELQTAESNIQSLDENKVSKEEGKDLSSNDFTDDDVAKLDGIEAGAEVNVQSDYAQEDTTLKDYIKNKPTSSEKSATSSFKTINGGLLTKCVVDLEPIQDLHGYDYPWVGGAKVNLMPSGESKKVTEYGVTWECDGLGRYHIYGTPTQSNTVYFNCEEFVISSDANANLYLFNNSSNQGVTFDFYNDSTLVEQWSLTPINRKVAYIDMKGKTCNKYAISVLTSANIDIYLSPMIANNGSETEFSQYSNICPISGHTEADVLRRGKNLLDTSHGVLHQYTSDPSVLRWGYPLLTLEAGTYTISYIKNTSSYILYLNYTDDWSQVDLSPDGTTITLDREREVFIRSARANTSTEQSFLDLFSNVQLEKGSTATTYEPYKGQTYIINLNGTYYGGYIDVVSGEFVATHGVDVYDGSSDENWSLYGQGSASAYAMTIVNENIKGGGQIKANMLQSISESATWGNYDSFISMLSSQTPSNRKIVTGVKAITTVADWRTFLSNNPLTVCYELATPQTIQLTPTQIEALVGVNYIDTPLDGQSIETDGVGYKELFEWDDVVNYVQSVINA